MMLGPKIPRPWRQSPGQDHLTLYLAHRGSLARLGDITAFEGGTFAVPPWVRANLADVHLVARPLGGRSYRSESFVFTPGATAVWTIENRSVLSHVVVR